MPTINRLPGPDDGFDGLMKLTEQFGAEQVFGLIQLCRLDAGEDKRPASEMLTHLAGQMVVDQMDSKNVDRDTARRQVADNLGYKPTSRTNFYKILDGVPRRSLGRGATS